MTPQQKIQAAIDALPHATGGDWRLRLINYGTTKDLWCVDWSDDQEEVAEYVYGTANATLIAAAKDLAEEVVRLRGLLDEAFRSGELVHQLPRATPQSSVAGMYEIDKMPEGKLVVGDQIVEEASKQSGIPVEALLAPIPGMYKIDKMPEGKLVVGDLEICKQAEGSVWIQDTTSQEGFETPVVDLEHTLRGFWQANI